MGEYTDFLRSKMTTGGKKKGKGTGQPTSTKTKTKPPRTATQAPAPLESAIQAAIIDYLRLRGYYVLRLNSGAVCDATGRPVRMAPPGTPDLLLLKDGHSPLFVEVKRPGQKPTRRQVEMMAALRAHGATTLVATSVADLEAWKL